MISLARFFFPHITRFQLNMAALFIVGIIGVHGVFNQPQLSFHVYVLVSFFLIGFIATVVFNRAILVSRNLSWLMVAPVTKRRLLLLNYVLNLVSLIFYLANIGAVFLVTECIVFGRVVSFDALKVWLGGDRLIGLYSFPEIAKQVISQSPCSLILYVFGFSVIHVLGMSLRSPVAIRPPLTTLWKGIPKALRWFIPILTLAFVLLLGFLLDYFASVFSILLLVLFAAIPGVVLNATTDVALGREQKRRWISASGFSFLGISSVIYVYATAVWVFGNPAQRADSILFLGRWSLFSSRERVATLLMEDVAEGPLRELIHKYQKWFLEGQKVGGSTDPYLTVSNFLAKKSSLNSAITVTHLFEAQHVSFSDLKVLFSRLESFMPERPSLGWYLHLINVPLASEEVVRMLGSTSENGIFYGLLRARYDRDPAYVSAIRKFAGRYSDRLRVAALDTFSILEGEYRPLNSFLAPQNGRSIAFSRIDCENFKPVRVNAIDPRQMGEVNVCVRKAANRSDPALLETIEREGWWRYPLTPEQGELFAKVMKVRR